MLHKEGELLHSPAPQMGWQEQSLLHTAGVTHSEEEKPTYLYPRLSTSDLRSRSVYPKTKPWGCCAGRLQLGPDKSMSRNWRCAATYQMRLCKTRHSPVIFMKGGVW